MHAWIQNPTHRMATGRRRHLHRSQQLHVPRPATSRVATPCCFLFFFVETAGCSVRPPRKRGGHLHVEALQPWVTMACCWAQWHSKTWCFAAFVPECSRQWTSKDTGHAGRQDTFLVRPVPSWRRTVRRLPWFLDTSTGFTQSTRAHWSAWEGLFAKRPWCHQRQAAHNTSKQCFFSDQKTG